MPKKKVTLSIDSKIYAEYKKFCEENGMILSKQIENFIKTELRKVTKVV